MSSPASPAETRAFILERLIGATGEPDRVLGAARKLADGIAEALLDPINALLSAPIEIEAGEVSLARLGDAMAVPFNQPLLIAALTGQTEPAVLSLDTAAMSVLLNGLFGADPRSPVAAFERPLSPLDLDAAGLVLWAVADAFNDAADAWLRLRLPLGPVLTGPERAKVVMRDGPGVRISLVLKAPGGTGLVTITLSERGFAKPAADNDVHSSSDWSARFGEEIKRSTISLEATVPMGPITLGEIAGWRSGMTIELPAGARSATKLSARDRTLFVCEFGRLGQSYTVRIDHPFDAGQDLIEDLLGAHP